MGEQRTIRDPFFGKDVQISNRLTDRLRGKYACGPTLPNGEPEFGWRQHETPPIQHQAADHIDMIVKALQSIANNTCCEGCQEAAIVARATLASLSEGK